MKIGIVGAGSIGLLIGARLAVQHQVCLFTRTEKQADSLRKNGLTLINGSETTTIQVQAESFQDAQQLTELDLILVTLKQYHLPNFIQQMKASPTTFLFLQNGLAHLEQVRILEKAEAVWLGIVEIGAMRLDLATVQQNGSGRIVLGSYMGNATKLAVAQLSTPQLPIVQTPNLSTTLKEKLLVNAVINPLSAAYHLKNGELLNHVQTAKLLPQLLSECCDVLGFTTKVEKREQLKRIAVICQNTYENLSSMLYDIEHGRETEIDAILGYIIEKAQKSDVAVPVCMQLFHQVKRLEKGR